MYKGWFFIQSDKSNAVPYHFMVNLLLKGYVKQELLFKTISMPQDPAIGSIKFHFLFVNESS